MICFIFEDLVPLWVGTPDLHVVVLVHPRLIVVPGSDGQRLLMEIPDLSLSSIWCLDDHVSVINQVEISVILQFRDNIEISLDIETEIRIEFTLYWLIGILISINELPLLIDSSVFVLDYNVSIFIITCICNIHNLSSLIYNEFSILLEELPPSWIDTIGNSQVRTSTVRLDF